MSYMPCTCVHLQGHDLGMWVDTHKAPTDRYRYMPSGTEVKKGSHILTIVGWSDIDQYWLVKNSW